MAGNVGGVTEATGVATATGGAAVGSGVATTAGTGVGVGGVAITTFETDALQITSEPPPLPDPLHWSMFTGSVEVIVDPVAPVQVNPTLVPPLPEPLH